MLTTTVAHVSTLRTLPFSFRLGITLLCVLLGGGFAASAGHLFFHDHKRDERPGLTVDDVKGVYKGIRTRAPLLVALESNHPPTLPPEDSERLIKWLTGNRITEDYDNFDLGENAPAEIIARNCVSCHARNASDPVARKLPLEFLDDIKSVAVSRDITPNSIEIVTSSTHTHAISLATLSFVLGILLVLSRFRGRFTGIVFALHAFGLLSDIGGWWLTRLYADFAYMIVAGGAIYFISTAILTLQVLADIWLPNRTTTRTKS